MIVNGGFETGNFSGWTVSGNPSYSQVGNFNWGYDHAHSGSDYAMLGSYGSLSYLSQTLATVPSGNYDLSFYLASDGGMTNEFSVDVGGVQLFDQINLPASNYTLYNFDFVANSSSTTVAFGSRDDPGYLLLDDVSVVDPPGDSNLLPTGTGAPLPAPFWMALAPMALMLGAAWRMKHSALGF